MTCFVSCPRGKLHRTLFVVCMSAHRLSRTPIFTVGLSVQADAARNSGYPASFLTAGHRMPRGARETRYNVLSYPPREVNLFRTEVLPKNETSTVMSRFGSCDREPATLSTRPERCGGTEIRP
jgi:hypothetical protein